MFQIGVQLYSLRDQAALGFVDVLKMVANMGYKGVEPAGLYGMTPKEFKKIVNDLGMEITSSHGPWLRSVDEVDQAVQTLGEMGLNTACCGFGPNDFKDMDAIKKTADLVNAIGDKLAKHKITLFQHNHAWEFDMVNGKLAYEIYAEMCPNVKFEMDCYWSANYGKVDPVAVMKQFRDRVILVHMKDGTFDGDIPMLPLGTGKLPIPAILKEVDQTKVKWVIVELDNCVIDSYRGIKKSYIYMTKNGICQGNV